MTLLGTVWIAVAVLSAFRLGRRGVLFATAAAVPLYNSALVDIGNVTISPFYIGLIVYLLWTLLEKGAGGFRRPPRAMGVLFLYSLAATLLGPIVFGGVTVVSDAEVVRIGNEFIRESELSFSASNLAQLAYLTLGCLLVLSLESRRTMLRCLTIAFVTGLLLAGWAWLTPEIFPHNVFDNSSRNSYAVNVMSNRLRGQFAEPSHLGAFVVASLPYFLLRTGLQNRWWKRVASLSLAALSAGLLVASASGTAIAGGAIALVVCSIVLSIALVRGHERIRVGWVLFGIALLNGLVLISPQLVKFALGVVSARTEGISDDIRSHENEVNFELILSTFGLGAGLGSTRGSSLFLVLLASIGVIGTAAFLVLTFGAVWSGAVDRESRPTAIALLALLIASFVSYGLLTPPFWMLLAAVIARPSVKDNGDGHPSGEQHTRSLKVGKQ